MREQANQASKKGSPRNGTYDPVKVNDAEIALSDDIINAIGKRSIEPRVLAPPLHSQLAVRWEDVIKQGLNNEEKIDLIKKYPLPENCIFSDPPKINSEIKPIVQQTLLTRDMRIVAKQEKIAAGLAAISKALTHIVKDGKDIGDLPAIESLTDAIRLLADVQRDESMIRRSLILSKISTSLKDTLSETTCSAFLFGEKLDETVKSAKALEVTAKQLRAASKPQVNRTPKNSYNPPRPREKYQQRTSGGQKTYRSYKKSDNLISAQTKNRKEEDRHRRQYKRR